MDIKTFPNATLVEQDIIDLPSSGCAAIGHVVAAGQRVLLLKHSDMTIGIDLDKGVPTRSWLDQVNGRSAVKDVKYYRIKSIELEEL